MSEPTLQVGLSDDASAALLVVTSPLDRTQFVIQHDAAAMDELILALGTVRAAMSEPVTPRLDPNSRAPSTRDPAWWCSVYPDFHGLFLRHPGFGWLAFVLPRNEAKAIAGWLLREEPTGG